MGKTSKILIVEDEAAIRRVLVKILEEESSDYVVDAAENGEEALQKITGEDYDLVISDIKMPKMDGEELLVAAKKIKPDTVFVMISGHGDLETAVNTMRLGAFDYISKPPDLNRLLTTVRNALDTSKLVVENTILKKKVGKKYEMIGNSEPISQIKDIIEKVAPTEARVLITGPNGTGKELVAHQIHLQSNRAQNMLVEVNCAAIPSELIESELFGHVKGAFTSAVKDRPGKFEQANHGTIFLDEIGDMSLSAQAKVLRALQENVITRVGAEKDLKVDVRVIAATNKDLRKEIAEGRFREDLYHRLAVILIKVPALNDRRDDIPLLIEHFVSQIAKEQGTAPKAFSSEAIELLQQYDWTGNIRELRNVIERLIILGGKEVSKQDVEMFANK
ncbi:sigma-54-dependent Fis family transcriptional regulator [Myroides odoratimimus]|uniref:sigma-54-dependent transcriptional regulator n=1 Tax=Myroides odoratimimus TaxID=76832 RepID=UPI00103863A7|nr:sigma-54 dependent transcriptional regulator [Myroides odoratimimus]MCA4792016.1 sigma-54-dependent Fis family transcriptional regulator [Myroides odoratimimus]MCA4805781.1 sigma-54-dependent Fis family transcriptional regulator [Myroides odoratimimus]MCA4819321.1 sigma-54-dependent Fis family transcriptional regulator [Myroides odoratimimus]MCS7472612.1 sigma-54 dependent transcriptional regulator [Myroides odoratimimus]MDM1058450.1 sigma-54-dependent Fis family transcriptional regulator [